jgi:hypothetical protein
MPVEIKELVIRAVTTMNPEDDRQLPRRDNSLDDKAAIIQACVKQVLKILEKKKER